MKRGFDSSTFPQVIGKTCKKSFFLWAQTLSISSNFIIFPQHDLLTHKCLLCSLALVCAREYSWTIHALAPFFPTPTSFDTTSTLTTLHPESNGYFSLFLQDYKPDQDLKLFSNSFKLTFQCMPHISVSGPSRMVFEHFWDCFHHENSMSGFL